MAIKIEHSANVYGTCALGGGGGLPENKGLYVCGWDTARVIVDGSAIKDNDGNDKLFPRLILDYKPLTPEGKNAASFLISETKDKAACVFVTTLTRKVVGYSGDDTPLIYEHAGAFMDIFVRHKDKTGSFEDVMNALVKDCLAVEADGKAWMLSAHSILKKDKNGRLYPSQYYDLVH